MRVQQRMTPNPITVNRKTTHREAVEIMRKYKIRRLPVVDADKHLVGIVTQFDILSTSPSPATTLSIYEIYTLLDKLTVDQFMTKPVMAVNDQCSLAEAARYMIENQISALPVMQEDKLVGIITETDIFKAFVEVLGGGIPGARFDIRTVDRVGALADITRATADAGGNIVSLTQFHGEDAQHALISIKERGAEPVSLQTALEGIEQIEILDFNGNGGTDKLLYFG